MSAASAERSNQQSVDIQDLISRKIADVESDIKVADEKLKSELRSSALSR
jgi:hypothetical protein